MMCVYLNIVSLLYYLVKCEHLVCRRKISLSPSLAVDCKLFTLDSINTFRKYISLLDLILTCLLSTHW
uniref:Uncharacterized protein n=1 Tax=Megaselia scalaris TaxID=36166 RepID=T1GKT7_MEGSC